MATITYINDTLLAIDNNNHNGVFLVKPEQMQKIKTWVEVPENRIKYMWLPKNAARVGCSQAAYRAWYAANFRSQDQTSPLGHSEYETEVEGVEYLCKVLRYEHTCPWAGEKWIVQIERLV
jgi:hypothetical protein